MKAHGINLELSRIEVKKTSYDKKDRIVEEEWEFWFPPNEKPTPTGYRK